ncbi:MAG: hypothetical protein QF535_16805 [Anaerolineales bacterium]|nr:hypothetical protein [Anaerolineales bacterium]
MGRYLLPAFVVLMIAAAVAVRLLPHPPNFTPIGTIALFAGLYLAPKTKWGLLLPIAVMLATDLFIGVYDIKLMAVVYGSFMAYVGIGWLVGKKKQISTVVLGTFAGACTFFATTNFAVWALYSHYPATIEGLVMSYTMALPFFKYALMGDLFFVAVFIGSYELATRYLFQESSVKKLVYD